MFAFLLVLVLKKRLDFHGHQTQEKPQSTPRLGWKGTELVLDHNKINFLIPCVQIPWIYLRIRKRTY